MATGLLGIPMRSIVLQAGQAQQETSSP